jgi:16S rRNA (cytidine1402-2'-O)-methyltransferase
LKSFHKDNEIKNLKQIINDIKNKQVALVSDAGTPCISDPGYILINKLISENISFEVLPGATAFVPALIYSGFPTKNFMFVGFLNHKKTRMIEELKYYRGINGTLIFYESVHRIKNTLKEMLKYFKTPISVSRELTKKFEENFYITSEEDISNIKEKGEFVIVVNNVTEKLESIDNEEPNFSDLIEKLYKENFTNRDIIKILKSLGLKRNDAYKLIEDFKK